MSNDIDRPTNAPASDTDERTSSRRTLFKLAGVGLAGVAGATLLESPAEAATGLVLGTINTESANTALEVTGNGSTRVDAFSVTGSAGGYGLTSVGGDSVGAGSGGSSIYAQGGANGGDGVAGYGGDSTNASIPGGRGLLGTGGDGTGVEGGLGVELSGGDSDQTGGDGLHSSGGSGTTGGGLGGSFRGGGIINNGGGSGGYGLLVEGGSGAGAGHSGTGIYVTGGSANGLADVIPGPGIEASGGDGGVGGTGAVGVLAIGGHPNGSPLLLGTNGVGAPTTGSRQTGEVWMDQTGTMFLCTSTSTPTSPAGWARVVTVASKSSGGATHLLLHPVRMYSGKIAAKKSATVHVTGRKVSGLEIPAGATGVIGTLSVSATGTHGYLSTFSGVPKSTTPLTTSLSWKGKDAALSAQVTIALSAAGTCVIANGFKGNSTTAHVTFDAVGYLA